MSEMAIFQQLSDFVLSFNSLVVLLMDSLWTVLEFTLASSAAIIALCGLFVSFRRGSTSSSGRTRVNTIALAAVVLGNVWLVWVLLSEPFAHGTVTLGQYLRFQRLFHVGLFTTSATFGLGLFGKGRGRMFAISATAALFVLWLKARQI